MKKLLMLPLLTLASIAGSNAADITVYHSPSCPHCHHARDFISNELVYEYQTIKAEAVNVMEEANRPEFENTLKKCNYTSGGVPVIIVGDKCFQGYADFMKNDLRDAASVGLSDSEKATAAANTKEFESNPEQFKAAHPERANVMVERDGAQKKNSDGSGIYFYGLLIVLVLGLGAVLLKKKNK